MVELRSIIKLNKKIVLEIYTYFRFVRRRVTFKVNPLEPDIYADDMLTNPFSCWIVGCSQK
jgi:hypothetical protein